MGTTRCDAERGYARTARCGEPTVGRLKRAPKASRRRDESNAPVALTAIIAWENAPRMFNRALRLPSRGL